MAVNGMQIFRAKVGAAPIFSDTASEIEALEEIRRSMAKGSVIYGVPFIAILIFLVFVSGLGSWRWVLLVLYTLLAFPFVQNAACLFGISRMIRKKRKPANTARQGN